MGRQLLSNPRNKRPDDAGGFTLMELVVVIVVMGLLAAVAIPQLMQLGDLTHDSAARQLETALRLAQNLAVTRHTTVGVSMGSYGYHVRIWNGSGWNEMDHPSTKESFCMKYAANRMFKDIALTSPNFGGQSMVAFDYLGTPYAVDISNNFTPLNSTGSVGVTSPGRSTKWIYVKPTTGMVYT